MHQGRVLTLFGSCPDRSGIVAEVAQAIGAHGGWILETAHHSDVDSARYFMRFEIKAESLKNGVEAFMRDFAHTAQKINLSYEIADSAHRKRLAILVSKEEHCLYDLLARQYAREWNVDIPLVVSNHSLFRELVEWHHLRFESLPMNTPQERENAFVKMDEWFQALQIDVIVLARFMQIVPPWMCARYRRRMINIHHSFLPSFVGAKPYHQAFERGVKLIGATCHYVTEDLDEGPIIEQDVIRIDHSDTIEDIVRYGKDIEKTVLSRGLRYHLEDRVLENGLKTVVFR